MKVRSGLKSSLLLMLLLAAILCASSGAYADDNNGLWARAVGDTEISGNFGETVMLSVEAGCDEGSLHYRWISEMYPEDMEELDAAQYPYLIRGIDWPACAVSDDYGNTEYVDFSVSVINGFYAQPVAEEFYKIYGVIRVPYGERATLQVDAGCDQGSLTFEWQYYDNGYIDIPGETAAVLTTPPITEYISYYCHVRDEYGNTKEVRFEVDPTLKVTPSGTTTLYADYGGPVTLEVQANGSGLIYYEWRDANKITLRTDSGASASYTIESVTDDMSMSCYVYDNGGNSEEVFFQIDVNEPEEDPDPDELPALELNVDTTVDITEPGQIRYFSFTPAVTGNYKFFSIGNLDTYAYLYDPDDVTLAQNDDGDYRNFVIQYPLNAGQTYKLGVRFYSPESIGSFTVRVVRDALLQVEPVGNTYFYVKPGSAVSCAVRVNAEREISCQWYWSAYSREGGFADREPIAGATAASYTASSVSQPGTFICVVTDEYGNSKELAFSVSIDNGLRITSYEEEIGVSYGEQAVLEVNAVCDHGSLSYRWSSEQLGELSDVTGAVCTTQPITGKDWYSCEISDEYGNSRWVSFVVFVDNGLQVTASGEEIGVSYGEQAVLEVSAVCDHGALSYRWSSSQHGTLSDVTGTACTTQPITKSDWYYCTVSDVYGNEEMVQFHVYVDTGLSAEPAGNTTIYADYNSPALLKVNALCNLGGLRYRWYGPDGSIADADSDSYTVPAVTGAANYYCYISDDYGNEENICFEVRVENAFSAVRAGSAIKRGALGDTLDFQVDARCRDGVLTYTWYMMVTGAGDIWPEEIADANSPSLTVTLQRRLELYICTVTDQYGNSRDLYFNAVIPDFTLPDSLTHIESQAFAGIKDVIVWAPPSVTEIEADAFDNSTLVLGEPGSYAEAYAKEHTTIRFLYYQFE